MRKGTPTRWIIYLFLIAGIVLPPVTATADSLLLRELITAHNRDMHNKSLEDGSYRGEEGILRIRPEVAKHLGMVVMIDQDYLDAGRLFKAAEKALNKAKSAMITRRKEGSPDEHARRIVEYFIRYSEGLETARQKLLAYRSRLNPGDDERMSEEISARVMDRLIKESLGRTGNRLRDALAHFYNSTQGMRTGGHSLTQNNVEFVNDIFQKFTRRAGKESLKRFHLDRDVEYYDGRSRDHWKEVMLSEGFPYVSHLETVLGKKGNGWIDPLLFAALMRRESNFDPLAISSAGAAGLTQIMPRTALDLGMERIYMPAYFSDALSLMQEERSKRAQAMEALFRIMGKDPLRHARRARELMQESLALGKKTDRMFSRYRRELLRKQGDDRLDPALAIEYGFSYFAGLMKAQKGDISLALASYNAGPHRVVKYEGIPPFRETVRFRNIVLEYYRGYLEKARNTR